MTGGTFVDGEKKIRPGTYINTKNAKPLVAPASDIGIVIMPLINHDWGPVKEFIEVDISDLDGQYSKLGYKMIDSKMLLAQEIFKNAQSIIFYKPNGGEVAKATIGNLTVTAAYPGTLGNKLKVVIKDSVISGKNLSIYNGQELLYIADKVVNVEDLSSCDWVVFSGKGTLTNTASTDLAGGLDTLIINGDMAQFLEDIETQIFNVVYFPLTDTTLLNSFLSKIKYFNYDIGKHVVGVCSGLNADCEFITNVTGGIKLNNGIILNAPQSAAWVAGASAAAPSHVDLTHKIYEGAIDTVPRLKDAQIKQSLKNGEFIFTLDSRKIVVENDINSLTTYTLEKNEDYSDNRFIRTLQDIKIRMEKTLVPNKYDTDEDGQNLAKQDLITILVDMEKEKALKNVDVEKDVVITKVDGDSIFANVALQPNRSAKKFYITVKTS